MVSLCKTLMSDYTVVSSEGFVRLFTVCFMGSDVILLVRVSFRSFGHCFVLSLFVNRSLTTSISFKLIPHGDKDGDKDGNTGGNAKNE